MSYSVNPSKFKSIFAVPTEIVDGHIRIANADQLKVLLWILRNSPDNPDISAMCAALKMNQSDALDYLQYWQNSGILINDGAEISAPAAVTAVSPAKATENRTVHIEEKEEEEIIPSKPSSAEIAIRIEESPEIGHLFNEAQQRLGKTIGYDGQCTLLLLHDRYGLPVEVLFMLIDYCVSVGKLNYGYIETIGKDWGKREIDTVIKAAEQIESLNETNRLWRNLAAFAGISASRPTAKQTEYLRRWSGEWRFSLDMIELAYDEMMNNIGKVSFAYMDKVLMNWHSQGFKNPSEVNTYNEQHKKAAEASRKKPSAASAPSTASYDLNKFNERSAHAPLKYERKKKE